MRANPHTTPPDPNHVNGLEPSQPPLCEPILTQRPPGTTKPTKPPRQNRHRASESSHSDPPSHPESRSRPPQPPLCEPILAQRPPGTTKPTKPPCQTAIVRANPYTTPHPPVHRAQSPCQHPNHLRFGYRRTALDFHARCGMLGTTQNPTPRQSESRDSRPGKQKIRKDSEDRKSGK